MTELEKKLELFDIYKEQNRLMAIKNLELDDQIEKLKKKNAEFEKDNKLLGERCLQLQKEKGDLIDEITEAKHIIKNITKVTWGEGWNYSLGWKVKAEQFISEVEK